MKTTLLSALFALLSVIAFSTSVTITNSGATFTPSTVTIQVGDTIQFQIDDNHNAIEVSLATWTADSNTPLPGFSLGFGGGTVTGLTAGTHYYVCAPHASIGMKGEIIVNTPTGINNLISGSDQINIYPNPTTGQFVVQYQGTASQTVYKTGIEVYNLSGNLVYSLPVIAENTTIDLSLLPTGTYFVKINDDQRIFTKKVVKY